MLVRVIIASMSPVGTCRSALIAAGRSLSSQPSGWIEQPTFHFHVSFSYERTSERPREQTGTMLLVLLYGGVKLVCIRFRTTERRSSQEDTQTGVPCCWY